ncbi:MAG: hypothetical protein IPK64_00345 [bacterium]|nr:hypothetical protein [bacterium]
MVRVLLAMVLMATTAIAQDSGPPSVPGKPAFAGSTSGATGEPSWQLGDRASETWFDRDQNWEAIDARALPGRDAEAARIRYFHNSAGVEFAQGAVTATFEPTGMGPEDRLSLLICSQVPPNKASRVKGYEISLDQAGVLKVLRLDGGDAPVLLATSTESSAALDPSLSYVLAVARNGAAITARVRAAGADEPLARISASDDRYPSGRVGLALPDGAGRVAAVSIVPVAAPVQPEPPGPPGQPGKPF